MAATLHSHLYVLCRTCNNTQAFSVLCLQPDVEFNVIVVRGHALLNLKESSMSDVMKNRFLYLKCNKQIVPKVLSPSIPPSLLNDLE